MSFLSKGFFTALLCTGLLCFGITASAGSLLQADSAQASPAGYTDTKHSFKPKLSAWGWVYLPKLSYSSERGAGFGLQGLHPFEWPGGTDCPRTSDIRLKGRVTTKGQTEAEATVNLRWGADETYYIRTKLEYHNLAQRFYGLGPDTPVDNKEIYQPQDLLAYVELFRKAFLDLKVGVRCEFEKIKLLETEPGGLLETDNITGTSGKSIFGAGVLLDWDTRDSKYSPASGSHYQFLALWFADEFGSEHSFNNFNIDLRNYFSITHDHVLATQFFIYSARGNPPFWRYAALGGRAHTRGYHKGRYLDRMLLAFQGEYRFPVWWRFGLVGFAGLGDVGPSLKLLKLEHMRPTVGGGIRFQYDTSDKINARLDIATGSESVRLYLALDEAF
jgi:outer membrane protein assembly factor BamA